MKSVSAQLENAPLARVYNLLMHNNRKSWAICDKAAVTTNIHSCIQHSLGEVGIYSNLKQVINK